MGFGICNYEHNYSRTSRLGKGTQADLAAEKFDLEHVDMGKMLREIAKEDTELGKEVYRIQNVTKTLVPSHILESVLDVKLKSLSREKGIVFDGVPRTVEQCAYLERILKETGRKMDAVILINIPDEESITRISKRWTCKKNQHPLIMGVDVKSESDKCPICGSEIFQRIDDSPEGVKKRLEIFKAETLPVVEYYKKAELLAQVDGTGSIEEVSKNIIDAIEKLVIL